MKICNKCGEVKPLSEFNRNKKCRGGYLTVCKACNKRLRQDLEHASPEMYERRLARVRAHKAGNRDHIRSTKAIWDVANRAHIQEYNKDSYASDPEGRRERSRLHRQKHPDRVKESWSKWAKSNHEAYRAIRNKANAKRRAAEISATVPWADMQKISRLYGEAMRLTAETGIPRHVDHIVPLRGVNVCGLHWEGNLQVLTAAENIRKSNKMW